MGSGIWRWKRGTDIPVRVRPRVGKPVPLICSMNYGRVSSWLADFTCLGCWLSGIPASGCLPIWIPQANLANLAILSKKPLGEAATAK
jgi:hypothetical protein